MTIGLFGLLGRLTTKKIAGSPTGVSLEVNANDAIRALGFIFGGLIDNRETLHRKIGIQLYGWVIRNFDAGGSMQSPSWAPLADSTRSQKAKHGYSSLPLIRTGNLRNSFASFGDAEVAGVGARASFGVDYAQIHQEGIGVPARDMLPPREYALAQTIEIYGIEIARLRKEVGI